MGSARRQLILKRCTYCCPTRKTIMAASSPRRVVFSIASYWWLNLYLTASSLYIYALLYPYLYRYGRVQRNEKSFGYGIVADAALRCYESTTTIRVPTAALLGVPIAKSIESHQEDREKRVKYTAMFIEAMMNSFLTTRLCMKL
jgi:hypothetical protein